jgi:hypothetical protein
MPLIPTTEDPRLQAATTEGSDEFSPFEYFLNRPARLQY